MIYVFYFLSPGSCFISSSPPCFIFIFTWCFFIPRIFFVVFMGIWRWRINLDACERGNCTFYMCVVHFLHKFFLIAFKKIPMPLICFSLDYVFVILQRSGYLYSLLINYTLLSQGTCDNICGRLRSVCWCPWQVHPYEKAGSWSFYQSNASGAWWVGLICVNSILLPRLGRK